MGADPSFFITGGTLPQGAPSYVARKADEEAFDALSAGEYCYILTARQMGKSSLMVRTASRLRDAGHEVLVIDLTALGTSLTPTQWYWGLLGIVEMRLGLDEELTRLLDEHAGLGPMQQFFLALERVVLPAVGEARRSGDGSGAPRRLVIFIDEIDIVRGLPFSTDEFFAAIRECYNRRPEEPLFERLSFCLLGVASPSDLIRDTRLTPFNIGRRIELTDFTEEEALPLAAGLGAAGLGGARAVLRRVLHWTGGHPYLTQRLCRELATAWAKEGAGETSPGARGPGRSSLISGLSAHAAVDRLCAELFLTAAAREKDDNLIFVRERLLRSEQDRAALLELYDRVRRGRPVPADEGNPRVGLLRLAGVTRVVERRGGGRLRVRNRIYRQVFDRNWVREQMPDAEVARQRRAYRRGVLRTAAVAAVMMAMLGSLTGVAMAQTGIALRNRRIADATAERERGLSRALRKEVAAKEQALRDLEAALGQATTQRLLARAEAARARKAERAERLQAERAEESARSARRSAVTARRERREALTQLSRFYAADGQRLVSEGDLHSALPKFALARKYAAPGTAEAEANAWRLAATASSGPRLAGLWRAEEPHVAIGFTRDGERLVSFTSYGKVREIPLDGGPERRRVLRFDGVDPLLWELEPETSAVVLQLVQAKPAARGATPGEWRGTRIRVPHGEEDDRVLALGTEGRVVTGDGKGLVRVRDAASGKALSEVLPHPSQPDRIWLNPTGTRMVTATPLPIEGAYHPMDVRILEIPSGRIIMQYVARPGHSTELAVRADVGTLAITEPARGRIWDVETGAVVGKDLPGNQVDFPVAALSADGRRALAYSPGGVRAFDVRTGEPASSLLLHPAQVFRVRLSRRGGLALTHARDGLVRLWRLDDGKLAAPPLPWALDYLPRIHTAWSGDERYLAVRSAEGNLSLWDLAPRPVADRLAEPGWAPAVGNPRTMVRIELGAGGKMLHVSGAGARIVDPDTRSVSPLIGSGYAAGVSPDGQRVACAGDDGVRLYDARGRPYGALMPHRLRVNTLAFSPDGERLATASGTMYEDSEGEWRLWDARTGRAVTPPIRLPSPCGGATFSRDGARILTWGGRKDGPLEGLTGHARIWDARTGRPLIPGCEVPNRTIQAQFSPDGRRFATYGAYGNAVNVWDAATGLPVAELALPGPEKLAFSEDGRWIAAGNYQGTIRVFDANSGEPVCSQIQLKGHWVAFLSFLRGRRILVAVSFGGGIQRFETATWTQIGPTALYTGTVDTYNNRLAVLDPRRECLFAVKQDGSVFCTRLGIPQEGAPDERALALLSPETPGGASPAAYARALREQPAVFRPDEASAAAWHTSQANAAFGARDWMAVVRQATAIVTRHPERLDAVHQRAVALAELGRYDQAAADLRRAAGRVDHGHDALYSLTVLRRYLGDPAGARSAAAELRARFRPGESRASDDYTAWAAAMAPSSPDEAVAAMPYAESALAAHPQDLAHHAQVGMLRYRAGRWAEALESLDRALGLSNPSDGITNTRYFRAMALRRLGREEEALRTLGEARRYAEAELRDEKTPWVRRCLLQLSDREAEGVVHQPPGPSPAP